MKELRCTKCGKLLLKAAKEYEASITQCDLEIQCTRSSCKAINHYKIK